MINLRLCSFHGSAVQAPLGISAALSFSASNSRAFFLYTQMGECERSSILLGEGMSRVSQSLVARMRMSGWPESSHNGEVLLG